MQKESTRSETTNTLITLVLLVVTTSLTIMSLDLYAPSLPHLPDYFGTTTEMVKLTVSLNALTYGAGTLVYGPLSERFGRKPILIGAICCAALCCLFCTLAVSIEQLIIARILLGLALAAEGVLVYSIINDCFSGKDKVRAFAVWGAACAVIPIFSPILGAYIFVTFGWRANFAILTMMAAILTLLLYKYLEETATGKRAVSIKLTGHDYLRVLRSRAFLCYAVIQSTAVGYFVLFPTAVPFILANQFDKAPEFYGYYQGGIIFVFILGTLTTRALVKTLAAEQVLTLGTSLVITGCVLLALVALFSPGSLPLLSVPLSLIAFGNAFLFTTIPPLAMDATESPAGVSSAALLTIQTTLGSLTSVTDSVLPEGDVRQFATIMGVVAVVAALALAFKGKATRAPLLSTDAH
ncbi:MAG: Bcr/CflA family efflux MFS transporter [Gammaproteobacteria bacterium]|nr:Bcr/CflA family efflux MFS transporter [Gammaproteobacteria bacterium]